jgi:ethanolamine ammonia-lyase large subunit
LNKRPAPEFEEWLLQQGIIDKEGNKLPIGESHLLLQT